MKHVAVSMAFTRQQWIEKFRYRFEGALGEYAKIKFSEAAKLPNVWESEVRRLMSKVEVLFDAKKVKTKQSFDLMKAAAEAFLEAATAQEQVTDSKKVFISDYLRDKSYNKTKLSVLNFEKLVSGQMDSEDMAFEMLEKFLPNQAGQILVQLQTDTDP